MRKLAIITTHPIQYNAPFFKILSQRGIVQVKVFYTWGSSVLEQKFDPGFGKHIQWDIPLLEGYEYEFVRNVSSDPGSHHFRGIDNPDLSEKVIEWKADAILVYGWSFKSHLKIMRRMKGKIPVYFRGDSTLTDSISKIKKIIRFVLLRWIYRHVDLAFFCGSLNKEYFLKFGLSNSQLQFMPHAVENSRFFRNHNSHIRTKDFRTRIGIPSQAIVFLFAGKFEKKKDVELLISSFVACKFSDDVQLLLVGNGPLENELKEQAANYDNIRFLDFQNQEAMPLLYRASDVFILPSRGPGETWGLSINEAMASQLPIIASDKCGAAVDLVKSAENGFVFPAGNSELLSGKLKWFYTHKDSISEMGCRSVEIIQNWSFQHDCEAIEKVMTA